MYFFFNDTATTEIYTLSLHDALPISGAAKVTVKVAVVFPLSPSVTVTSLMVRFGGVLPVQLLAGEPELRGNGAKTNESAALLLVSVQPPALLNAAVVFEGAFVGPDAS